MSISAWCTVHLRLSLTLLLCTLSVPSVNIGLKWVDAMQATGVGLALMVQVDHPDAPVTASHNLRVLC